MSNCSSTKTLVINYTAASNILPPGGYTIQWRTVGSSIWYTVANKTVNPITIPNVPTCFGIEGKILADCGTGELREIETFGVTGTSSGCVSYSLLDTATYFYTPCGGFQELSIFNNESTLQSVCAVEGSVRGGQFTYLSTCLE